MIELLKLEQVFLLQESSPYNKRIIKDCDVTVCRSADDFAVKNYTPTTSMSNILMIA